MRWYSLIRDQGCRLVRLLQLLSPAHRCVLMQRLCITLVRVSWQLWLSGLFEFLHSDGHILMTCGCILGATLLHIRITVRHLSQVHGLFYHYVGQLGLVRGIVGHRAKVITPRCVLIHQIIAIDVETGRECRCFRSTCLKCCRTGQKTRVARRVLLS